MFKKVGRALDRKSGQKFRFDLQIIQLENLPAPVKKCRVIWSRSAKVQYTDMKDVKNGTAVFKQTLSQVATMYMDRDKFEVKEYSFKVQVPGKGGDEKMLTIGKANIDMARYATLDSSPQNAMIPISFKVGQSSTGYLKLVVTSQQLKGVVVDDGMTEISGVTGMTSTNESYGEQDLTGFDESASGTGTRASRGKSASSKAASGPSASSAPKVAPVVEDRKPNSSAMHQPPMPAMPEERGDDDISPMNSEPLNSEPLENFFWGQAEVTSDKAAAAGAATKQASKPSSSAVQAQKQGAAVQERTKPESSPPLAKAVASAPSRPAKEDPLVAAQIENERLRTQLAVLQDRLEAAEQESGLVPQYEQKIKLLEEQLAEVAGPKIMSDSDLDSETDDKNILETLRNEIALLESEKAILQNENVALVQQLEAEHEEKEQLQEQLKRNLEDAGDEMAVETVAAFEVKYNRLKDRYRELEGSMKEELEMLHEQLREANETNVRLQKQLGAMENVRDKATREAKLLEENLVKNSRVSQEVEELRKENESMMHELVAAKLELAQLHEKDIICRRELYKAKETSMKLASKATKLETALYSKR